MEKMECTKCSMLTSIFKGGYYAALNLQEFGYHPLLYFSQEIESEHLFLKYCQLDRKKTSPLCEDKKNNAKGYD